MYVVKLVSFLFTFDCLVSDTRIRVPVFDEVCMRQVEWMSSTAFESFRGESTF